MVEFEADDALSSATARFKHEVGVEQIVICSPDKDLAQLISGSRIVAWDRRRDRLIDEAGVVAKFGVRPQSIPDWLGLVGDVADGFPGIPGWGEKSAAVVLAKYEHLEAIPADSQTWGLPTSRAARLAESLTQHWAEALLFRKLATLREDVPLLETPADLEWQGADAQLKDVCHRLGDEKFPERVLRWCER
jgi:5'-3' exonuclease